MQRRRATFILIAITLFGFVFFAPKAHADKVDRLITQLSTSKEYKVRLSAVLGLSKLSDDRAIPALARALKDSDKTVRGVAAAGLGKIVDSSTPKATRQKVLNALKRVSAKDQNSFVRSQAKKAYDVLKDLESSGGGAFSSIYVNVGPMASTAKSESDLKQIMKQTTEETLKSNASSMMISWPGRKTPKKKDLRVKGVKAFYVDGTLAKVDVSKSGSSATISCEVNMLIATFPDKSMFGFLKGGAAVQGGSSERDVSSGREDCVAAVVEDLVRRKIIPAIKTKAQQ